MTKKQLFSLIERLEEEDNRRRALQLLLTGTDICRILEIPPGPYVKDLLLALAEAQLEGEIVTKDQAEEWVIRAVPS